MSEPAQRRARPRVVLFRADNIDADTRAKKWAVSLERLGYEVLVLAPVAWDSKVGEARLGEDIRVLPVPIPTTERDRLRTEMLARRAWRPKIFSWLDKDAYLAKLESRRKRVRERAASAARLKQRARSGGATNRVLLLPWAVRRFAVELSKGRVRLLLFRQRLQGRLNQAIGRFWPWWGQWSRRRIVFATVRGNLPEVLDYSAAYTPVLLELEPDVLHAHHPFVLPIAVDAARKLRARGRTVRMIYDARENYAGIPEGEQGNRRRHTTLVSLEAHAIREFDLVTTVSEPIVEVLQQRYRLARRPGLILNVPVRVPFDPAGPDVRTDLGLGPEVPLLVYSGGMSRSRGIEDLMAAMPLLPGVHLALITVPHPHPMTEGLLDLAGDARERIHVLPPVTQDVLVGYLGGADVGVHPMPGGSPNHDMALPNKLFEYLHSGLTLAVSDAREMAAFVRGNGLGEVFPSHDPQGLAAAVQRALATRSGQSAADRQDLARRYSWQWQEAEIAALYATLAAGSAQRPTEDEDFPSLTVRWPVVEEVE